MKKSIIVEKPLQVLWLTHAGPPLPIPLDPQHREPLLHKLRDNFLASATAGSPLMGSGLLAEAIDDDPHLSRFKTAALIEPVLIFPCSDGIVVTGGLHGGRCPEHDHPLVAASQTFLPEERMHPDLREPWETLKNPTLAVTTCNQTFQHTAIVFHGFYLQAMSHKHEDVTDLMGRWGFGRSN